MSATVGAILAWAGALSIAGFSLVGIAYWIFQQWAGKWLDNRFAENLEKFKHERQTELQRLKLEIDALLDRAMKLHSREFEVLPEAWKLMDLAFGKTELAAMAFIKYTDLDRMPADQVEIYLKDSNIPNIQIAEILASNTKSKLYARAIEFRQLADAEKARHAYANYIAANGIFLRESFFNQFNDLNKLMISAFVERQMQFEHPDYRGGDLEGYKKLTTEGKALKETLLSEIRERLWSSANQVLSES